MMYTFYVERESLLHSLDPRPKIIGLAAVLTTLIIFNDPAFTVGFFILELLCARFLGRIGVREQLRLLKPLLPLVLFTVIMWPFIYTPRSRGLLLGVSFGVRLLAMGLATFTLLMTTPQRDLVLGFVKLGMPYEFGLTISIALRYIPTLYTLTVNIMDAQKSRGWEVEKGNVFKRAKRMSAVMIPLLVASLRTAHELSIALESRAFGAKKERTFLHDIRMNGRDYTALLVTALLFCAALYLRYRLGVGHISVGS